MRRDEEVQDARGGLVLGVGGVSRRAGLNEVRLVNHARQCSSSFSCGKRFLSRSGLIVAARRRRGDCSR